MTIRRRSGVMKLVDKVANRLFLLRRALEERRKGGSMRLSGAGPWSY